MSAQKLRLHIHFHAPLEDASHLARNIADASGLENAFIRFGKVAKDNRFEANGIYIEGRTDGQGVVQTLMDGALKSAQFELRNGSPIMPTTKGKDVWHISL